jgi:predicted metal-dependent phosphoesterase TrpH
MNLENYTNINIFKKVYENREVMSSNNMIEQPHHARKATEGGNVEHASGFNPYVNNQGTTIGKSSTVNQVSM